MPSTLRAVMGAACLACSTSAAAGEPTWNELKAPHFTVIADVGERETRAIAWRFEQARSAAAAICPWAHVDLAKPVYVLAARDERSMRALVPEYWEQKNAVRPVAVWLEGADRYYIALRADLREPEGRPLHQNNPYQAAYFAYMHVIVESSFPTPLPPWFSRGLAGVLSNTVVTEQSIAVGAPVLSYVQRLRERPALRLATLLATSDEAPELRHEDRLFEFDASAWAFVHFLLFADNGARRPRVEAVAKLLQQGIGAPAAIEQALAPIEQFQDDFSRYINRPVFQYQNARVDAAVKRDALPVRQLPPAEAHALRGAFYAATGRPSEARTAIADARRTDPQSAAAHVAEGLLLDQSGQQHEARAAYEKAIAAGADSAHAYYRCALLSWPPDGNRDKLVIVEKWLDEAVRRNERFAAAYASLGQIRAMLTGTADVSIPLVRRAIALEPRASEHRWSAAATYLALSQFDHAQAEAQAASRLAETEDQKRAATEMLRSVEAARASGAEREAADRQAAEASREASDVQARVAACGSGDAQACTSLVPWLEARCGEKDGGACGMLGFLHQSGRGVTQDSAQSARFFGLACEAGESRACIAVAVMQARGDGVPRDEASALATLERLCGGGMRDACTQLALVLASRQRPTDLPRIRELLDGSCRAGDAAACDLVKTIPAH